jgi:hypothetical protein
LVEQRNTSRLDGNATILLILTGIRQTGIAGVFLRDDTRRGDERIRERRLTLRFRESSRVIARVFSHRQSSSPPHDGRSRRSFVRARPSRPPRPPLRASSA